MLTAVLRKPTCQLYMPAHRCTLDNLFLGSMHSQRRSSVVILPLSCYHPQRRRVFAHRPKSESEIRRWAADSRGLRHVFASHRGAHAHPPSARLSLLAAAAAPTQVFDNPTQILCPQDPDGSDELSPLRERACGCRTVVGPSGTSDIRFGSTLRIVVQRQCAVRRRLKCASSEVSVTLNFSSVTPQPHRFI